MDGPIIYVCVCDALPVDNFSWRVPLTRPAVLYENIPISVYTNSYSQSIKCPYNSRTSAWKLSPPSRDACYPRARPVSQSQSLPRASFSSLCVQSSLVQPRLGQSRLVQASVDECGMFQPILVSSCLVTFTCGGISSPDYHTIILYHSLLVLLSVSLLQSGCGRKMGRCCYLYLIFTVVLGLGLLLLLLLLLFPAFVPACTTTPVHACKFACFFFPAFLCPPGVTCKEISFV